MNITRIILVKSLVKPYFRQNGGLILFLYFMMFLVVGELDSAGPLAYHYSLIRATLTDPGILILVSIAWLIYARKCERFIVRTLGRPDYQFLYILSRRHAGSVYLLLLWAQFLLFLPVTFYVSIIVGVGIHQHWYAPVLLVILYLAGLFLLCARWYLYLLQNPGASRFCLRWKIRGSFPNRFYWSFFIRYLFTKRKVLLLTIKLYSCGTLYMMIVHQLPFEYDLRMIILFYSFGLLGHGILIYRCRELENARLSFYRGLPVSLSGRFAQYGCLYLLLFFPEIITIGCLTPDYLHCADAFALFFFGYSVLLLMNSLLFIRLFVILEYLKIVTGLFLLIYIGVLIGIIPWLAVLFLALSAYLFFSRYYR